MDGRQELGRKLSSAGLYLLLLSGLLLGFATKGFAPMLAIAGALAFIGLVLEKDKLSTINPRNFLPIAPFLLFALISILWSSAADPLQSFSILISVLVFSASLWWAFEALADAEKEKLRNFLSASLLFGVIASICVGSYSQFFPELPTLLENLSNQTELGNIELLRQGNRSLSLMPIFLFLLIGFYWQKSRMFFALLFIAALYITSNSQSQTALLGLLLGGFLFLVFKIIKKNRRKVIFAVSGLCLLISPFVFITSFENRWIERFAPQIVTQKASGNIRQWLYYVYAKEALKRPLFGHGFEASQNFTPSEPEYYLNIGKSRIVGNYGADEEKGIVFPHAHNFPLQVIFEFGFVGSFLFLFALWHLTRLPWSDAHKSALSAGLGAVIGLLMFAYSMWQSWLMASLGFTVVYMLILHSDNRETQS